MEFKKEEYKQEMCKIAFLKRTVLYMVYLYKKIH